MKYFLDTEFNEFGGELISLALIREDGKDLYLVCGCDKPGAWVAENVMPILGAGGNPKYVEREQIGRHIAVFLNQDINPVIIVDWPDDVRYFCETLITGPGEMVSIPRVTFQIERVDAYPTTLPDAVQHNAWWDAMALRHLFAQRRAA